MAGVTRGRLVFAGIGLAVVAAGVAVVLLTLRSGRQDAPTVSHLAARSIVLITVDTLRADRVGAYGWKAARTPAMDAIAARGIRFQRAFAAAPGVASPVWADAATVGGAQVSCEPKSCCRRRIRNLPPTKPPTQAISSTSTKAMRYPRWRMIYLERRPFRIRRPARPRRDFCVFGPHVLYSVTVQGE